MIQVNVEKLDGIIADFSLLLGEEFVRNILDVFKTTGKKRQEVMRLEATAHPLAIWWNQLKIDSEKSRKDKRLTLSNNSIFAIALYDFLLCIKHLKNFERILNRIREKVNFYSACFEAEIAASYLKAGYDFRIVDEGKNKTCDFQVLKEGEIVSIECKSLENFAFYEKRHWDNVQVRLSRLMNKYKRPWKIDICSTRLIDGNDVRKIEETAERRLRVDMVGEAKTDDESIVMLFERLAEPDKEYPGGYSGVGTGEMYRPWFVGH